MASRDYALTQEATEFVNEAVDDRIEKAIEELKNSVDTALLKEDIDLDFSGEFRTLASELEDAMDSVIASVKTLIEEKGILEDEHKEAREEITNNLAEIEKLEKSNDELSELNDDLEQTNDELRKEIAQLKTFIEEALENASNE